MPKKTSLTDAYFNGFVNVIGFKPSLGRGTQILKPLTFILEPFNSLLFIDLPTLLPNRVGYNITTHETPHQIELFYILLHIIKIPDIFTRSLVGYVPTRVYSIMVNVKK